MIALDSECNGVDFYHGCKPFFITICSDDGDVEFYEWDVNPLTREPVIPSGDIRSITQRLKVISGWGKFSEQDSSRHRLIGQNAKFDCAALSTLGIDCWPWEMTEDTLIASHLLASNQPHNLTSLGIQYLGHDIKPLEDELEKAVKQCRRIIQQVKLRVKRRRAKAKVKAAGPSLFSQAVHDDLFPPTSEGEAEVEEPLAAWRIAEEGLPEMPSATGGDDKKGKIWKADFWLPAAYCKWAREQQEELATKLGADESHPVETLLPKDRKGRTIYPDWWEYSDPDHSYNTVLRDYSNEDSSVTMALWPVIERALHQRGLWKIYRERMKLPPIALGLESRGVTLSQSRLEAIETEYQETATDLRQTCLDIASSYDYSLTLPRSGGNHSLLHFCFGYVDLQCPECGKGWRDKRGAWQTHCKECRDSTWGGDQAKGRLVRDERVYLDLPVVGYTEGGNPQLDKAAIQHYLLTLNPRGRQGMFVRALAAERKRNKDLTDFCQYRRYGIFTEGEDTFVLHPNVNPTGTDTLRWSFSRPNSANIKKDESECEKCEGEGEDARGVCKACHGSGVDLWSVRRCFGPAPGREWWSLDFKNVELRIPAYESGEQELIDLFEHPDDPPYYGSQHLLNFSTAYQDVWEGELGVVCKGGCCKGKVVDLSLIGPHCKKRFAGTWYQFIKNTDFALQYGCQEAKADETAHRVGTYKLLKSRFKKQEALNQKYIQQANKLGYVTTLPDRSVDPTKGYPLMVTRTEHGRALPTVPLAYHVSGTAMWITGRAMVKCEEKLREWKERDGFDGWLALQVHDELVFDLPKRGDPVEEAAEEKKGNTVFRTSKSSNLWRVRILQGLMESCGADVGIPTPVGCEYHTEHWASGVTL